MCAEKRAHDELKKQNALARLELEEEGVQRLTALERSHEQEDEKEDEHLGLTGIAHGYLAASSKACAAQEPGCDKRKSKRPAGASSSEYEEEPVSSTESDCCGEVGDLSDREESEDETQITKVKVHILSLMLVPLLSLCNNASADMQDRG